LRRIKDFIQGVIGGYILKIDPCEAVGVEQPGFIKILDPDIASAYVLLIAFLASHFNLASSNGGSEMDVLMDLHYD
jgi:hypothetical protein